MVCSQHVYPYTPRINIQLGVYFAKDAHYSISGYARPTQCSWSSSEIQVRSCLALAEIVNLPSKFAHASSSFFVVPQTEWIVW